ncbi:MAG: DUF2066 domain-containing protein, partial [Planctomycetota bacterium]
AAALLVAGLPVRQAPAAQAVAVGDVTVTGNGDEALAEAMRTTLVRVTGRRAAGNDPALSSLVADARRYVQVFRPASGSSRARVTFDAAAIERAVAALGQPVWARDRPVVLGVITRAPADADPAAVRQALESAAGERGLPLKLVSAATAGLAGKEPVPAADAIAAARSQGADAALIGVNEGAEWQWTLFDGVSTTVFTGPVASGVEGAADLFALGPAAAVVAGPLSTVTIDVQGVTTLAETVRVQRLMEGLPGARRVALIATDTGVVRFQLDIPRGAEGLVEALASRSELSRLGAQTAPLTYRLAR